MRRRNYASVSAGSRSLHKGADTHVHIHMHHESVNGWCPKLAAKVVKAVAKRQPTIACRVGAQSGNPGDNGMCAGRCMLTQTRISTFTCIMKVSMAGARNWQPRW